MKKNFLQDVIPASQKRSIRDIPLPSHQKERLLVSKKTPPVKTYTEEKVSKTYEPIRTSDSPYDLKKEDHSVFETNQLHYGNQKLSTFDSESESSEITSQTFITKEPLIPTYKKSKKTIMKKIIVGVLLGIIVFAGFLLSRTQAVIAVHSKKSTEEINVIIPFDSKTPLVTKTQITKTLSKTLTATAEQQVEKQANGRIKIINAHKETSQELVKNTRFQTPNGLVYRIKDSIEIPGYTMSGSTIVPGILEVEVYADSAGEEYNISNTKFTIPGFAGREQFDKITAETVTNITGGYIGIRKVVSDDEKEKAQEEMESELKTQIEQTEKESAEYVIVPDPQTLLYGELQDKAEDNSVILTLSASVDAYSFVKKDLFNFFGQNSIEGALPSDQFTLDGKTLIYNIQDDTIHINGSTVITWITDMEKLKSDFAGKKKSEIAPVIDSYRSFDKTDAKLSPFWKTRFPSDSSKIEVVIEE